MKMYRELAVWWPLISPPSHYVEEAADLLPTLMQAADATPATVLELGCGGGSLASHLKAHFRLTLTDISPEMLEQSRRVNPECEHVLGDMRTIDLGRTFDLVFVHDAVMYMTDEASVRAAIATAARHCRGGGGVVIVPDCVRETFEAASSTHGQDDQDGEGGENRADGEDGADGRALRYLEWTWDPDPHDTTFEVAYAFLMRHPDGTTSVEMDRHQEGLFAREAWLTWLDEAGFTAASRMDPWDRDVFFGRKRGPSR
jgi:SAM-dependent methyltransferase